METKIVSPTSKNIALCSDELRAGGLVAFPTETVYGLGANALDERAVKSIYDAKGRPGDNPLIVHLFDRAQIQEYAAEVPAYAEALIREFMPGPLTLVLKKKAVIPDCVTGKMGTIAVRLPSHPVARLLLRACNLPVCAPSANTSTKPSPTTAKHVLADLGGKLPYILDGGSCKIGVESTILDVSGTQPRLLRLGGVPCEELEKRLGQLEIVKSSDVPLCPGMKYKHYAPKAEVLFSAYYGGMHETICARYDRLVEVGKNPVILCLHANLGRYGDRNCMDVGQSYDEYAHNLFYDLRLADERRFNVVIAEGVEDTGIGAAIINRLVKASGGQII